MNVFQKLWLPSSLDIVLWSYSEITHHFYGKSVLLEGEALIAVPSRCLHI